MNNEQRDALYSTMSEMARELEQAMKHVQKAVESALAYKEKYTPEEHQPEQLQ